MSERPLSWQQQEALKAINRESAGVGLTRRDFYERGIRMPTVYSLYRRGLVQFRRYVDDRGYTITKWFPADCQDNGVEGSDV